MSDNIKGIIKIMLKDYLRVVREHYFFDTQKIKKEFVKSIRDMIKVLS